MKNSIEALNWRYATKQFDATKKLSAEQLNVLTEALRLSASSYGLQPWKFIVVSNPALRQQLRSAAFNQAQITDASHLIVLAVRKTVDAAYVHSYVEHIAKTRDVSLESLAEYQARMVGLLQGKTTQMILDWATSQVYLALGTLLTVAAVEQIDACPMEGFDSAKFDTILGLDALGVQSAVVVTVGFRSASDSFAQATKVRWPKEQVIVTIE